jgi:hypothetical protein
MNIEAIKKFVAFVKNKDKRKKLKNEANSQEF